MEVSPFALSKVGRQVEMDIHGEAGQASTSQKNRQQQPRPIGQTHHWQGDKASPSNPMESAPGEKVWVDNVEAPVRTKTLRGENTLTLGQHIRLNQERERAANCEQRRLIFELSCDKETIPAKLIPDAALVYKILQEKLACCGIKFAALNYNGNIRYRPI